MMATLNAGGVYPPDC
jgi:hypothetical protein